AIVGGLAAAEQPAASSEDDDGSGTDADPAANAEASTARGLIGADGFGRGIAPVADLIGDHSAVGGLFGEVREPAGADGFELARVPQRHRGGLFVVDRQSLLHEVGALGLIEFDVLGSVELVELLAAPAVLTRASVAVGVGALSAGGDAQLIIRIRVDRPGGEINVVVALGGALRHRVDIGRLGPEIAADVLHPRPEELRGVLL